MRASFALVLTLLLAACGVDQNAFRGTLGSPQETGVLDLTIGGSVKLPSLGQGATTTATNGQALGVIGFAGGRQVSISGTYDPSTGAISLTGTANDGVYTLTGASTPTGFSGTYTGPHGNGTFVVLPQGAGSGAVEVFCGTYAGDSQGVWNVIVSGGTAAGAHCGEDCGTLQGTVSGILVSLNDGKGGTATGTRTGDGMSGTWTSASGTGHGTWTGSASACTTPVPPAPKLPVSIVPSLDDAFDFAVTDTRIYAFSSGEIHDCDIGGCGIAGKVAGPFAVPSSLAANGTRLTWASDFHDIFTCDTAAGACTPQLVLDVGSQIYPVVVRQTATSVYWHVSEGASRRIEKCDLANCAATRTTVLDAPNALDNLSISDVEWDATHLYVQTFQGPLVRFDVANDLANPATHQEIGNTGFGAMGIAIDGTSLLRTKPAEGKVVTCALPDCAGETDLATGIPTPVEVDANSHGVFILSRGTPNGQGGVNPNSGQVYWIAR